MDRNQKIQLLLDMQEHPEQFSEQALQTMLDDPEVRELMEATVQLKQAMISEEFVDERSGKAERNLLHSSFQKVAATFIGILIMSGITFAAIYSLTPAPSHGGEESDYHQGGNATEEVTTSFPHRERLERESPVRYEEATLEQILTDMAHYYELSLNWKSEEAKTLRLFYTWNKQLSASESMRQLNNFERFHLELNDSIITVE